MSVIDVEKTIRHSTKEDEILEQLKLVEGSNLWTITLRRMRKDQLGMFGLGLVLALIVIAVVAFILQTYDNWFGLANPTADPWDLHNYFIEIWIPGTEKYLRLIAHPKHIIAGDEGLAPSFQYPFGTDLLGHDIFSRMIFGTPLSLALGITGQLLTSFLGAVIGAISGYYGGLFDEVVQRINEIVMGLPDFILFIFAVALFGEVADLFDGGYYIVVLTILSLLGWGGSFITWLGWYKFNCTKYSFKFKSKRFCRSRKSSWSKRWTNYFQTHFTKCTLPTHYHYHPWNCWYYYEYYSISFLRFRRSYCCVLG